MSDRRVDGWAHHRREQLLHIARNTTPEQRFAWLEEMVSLFSHQILEMRKREQEEIDRLWAQPSPKTEGKTKSQRKWSL